jgi:hypothetical protein
MALGRVVGQPAEYLLMTRSSAGLTLTQAGAVAISARYGREVVALPHVVRRRIPVRKQRLVFVPGYVSDIAAVSEVVEVVRRYASQTAQNWTVVVGVCASEVAEMISALDTHERLRVRLTGMLTEPDLLALYDRAAVVVRPAPAGAANTGAASGPLCWAAAAGCVVLTSDARAGARELETSGLIIRSDQLTTAIERALQAGGWDVASTDERRTRAMSRMGVDIVARNYAAVLHDSEVSLAPPQPSPLSK